MRAQPGDAIDERQAGFQRHGDGDGIALSALDDPMFDLERKSVERGAIDVGQAWHIARKIMGREHRRPDPPIRRERMAELIFGVQRPVSPRALTRAAVVLVRETGIAWIADVGRRREPEDIIAGHVRNIGAGFECQRHEN